MIKLDSSACMGRMLIFWQLCTYMHIQPLGDPFKAKRHKHANLYLNVKECLLNFQNSRKPLEISM